MIPSSYQNAIYDYILAGTGHAMIQGVAGCGKTQTLLGIVERAEGLDTLLSAFNKSIATELEGRIRRQGSRATVKTYHAIGLAIITRNVGRPEVQTEKLPDLIAEEFGTDTRSYKMMRSPIEKLVRFLKSYLLEPTLENLEFIADNHGIEWSEPWENPVISAETVLPYVTRILERCWLNKVVIDFDDMVWIAARGLAELDWTAPRYDLVLSDESQDLSEGQRRILLASMRRPHGRLIFVGDEKQSIFGWRGATPDSMRLLQEALQAPSFPLSICYRCPTKHLDMARQLVPQIEARPDAPEGVVEFRNEETVIETAKPDDMILSRRIAPLVRVAFRLIARGRKAQIRGKDLGKGLITLLDKLKATSMVDLYDKLSSWCVKETEKLIARGKDSKIQEITDKVECIRAVGEAADDVPDLRRRIGDIFSDEVVGTQLSTIHRAKGLEADVVYLLEHDRLPLKWKNMKPWEVEQEKNVKYVALTRSKRELYLVPALRDNQTGGGKKVVGVEMRAIGPNAADDSSDRLILPIIEKVDPEGVEQVNDQSPSDGSDEA